MKPQKKLYDHILHEGGSVANVAELQQRALNYPHPEHSLFPGPLFHAMLYNIEDTKSAGLVYYGNSTKTCENDAKANLISTSHGPRCFFHASHA